MNASATPITNVVNGSFEETTAPHWDYWGTGTFSAAASWIDLTQTGNAGSLSSGLESITATAGTRLLRLATEANGINGRYAQYLGTMVAGETYTFRADVIASSLAYGTYTAKAAFVSEATVTPGTTYASQRASAPQGGTGGFILSYTALPADDGQPLYIWLQAEPPSAGAVTRGGIDRARLEGPSLFTENFDSYANGNPGGQYETGLTVAWGGNVAGWDSSVGSAGVIHAVQLNASPNWAPMFYHNDRITLATGIAANDTGISYGVTFKCGPAVWADGSQRTTAADYLLVEVLRPDDTVLASGTYYPKDWSNPANANLSAGRRGLLPYVGDGSGVVRLRISGPLNGRFNGEIDDIEVLQNPIVPPAVPAEPSSPSPANGAGIVGVSTTLTWADDPLATSYDVFLWPVGDAKPGTATATVTDPTWSPSPLLAATTYQWQVVAVNANGSTPGPVWTFTTGVIPYTYVYETDSIPPNFPAERATPYFLNDGLVGPTWDPTTILYYSATQSTVQPHVTLTLDPNAGLGRLTVWYTRWTEAGIFVPASLTVSDDFGHSTTTDFVVPPGNHGVFSQDVALTGMEGMVLHLNFATASEAWVGLNEIRVFAAGLAPVLTARATSNGIMISWPGSLTNYLLEAATDLLPQAAWSPVTNLPPQVIDDQWTLTLPPVLPGQFFRLVMRGAIPPRITTSLQGNTVAAGGNFTLTATGVGTSPFTLQWYFNGNAISGATNSSYTVAGANGSHQGDYRVVVTSAQGSAPSSVVHITVTGTTTPTVDPSDTYPGLNLIPWPKSVEVRQGQMELTAASRIVTGDASLNRLADIFSHEIKLLTGLSLPVVSGAANAGDIVLNFNPAIKADELILMARPPALVRTTDGAHTLTIGEQAVVEGFDYRAVAEGTATLLQAITRQGSQVTLPRLSTKDWPHADYTGAMVDVARQDNPIVCLKQMIDTCRACKTRYLQLHMTEDQAWTFPSTAYPTLGTLNGSAHGGPRCEVYDLNELKALVKYADDRGVTLVPELETPGHSGNACGTLPAIFGYIDPATGNAVGQGMMNIANTNLYVALDTIIGEMCDVFQSSPYFHIGFDEVSGLGNVAATPEAAAFMTARGLANSSELLAYFALQVNEMVKKRGKKTIIWEGAVTGVSKEIIHMTWEYNANTAAQLVAQGFTTITVPWGFAGVPWTNWTLYHCNGSVLKKGDSVLGAMFPAWEQQGEVSVQWLRGLPTRQERTWGPDNAFTEAGFALRLAGSDRVLDRMLYGFAIQYDHPVDVSSLVSARVTNNQALLTLEIPPALGTVRCTVDGTEPTAQSPAADTPIRITDNCTLQARLFDSNGQASMPPWKQVYIFDFEPVTLSGLGTLTDAAGNETAWFVDTMSVIVTCTQTDGVVRYTVDGSDPQPTSPAYSGAITLTNTATVKARWFDATNTGRGNVTAATWTLTTRPIPYTYVYETDSIPPNFPAELATPYFLNDGLIGLTWDSTTILYYSAAPSSVQPHVTLTLASNAGLGKLTVWYTRWTEAGIFVPHSLTVSDDFGHNSTTVFTVPPGNHGVFTQDVALTGMEGTVLHLNFATAGEAWLGLNEIRVSAAR